MATLSSSTSSIHRDIRSESRSYKRDKEHNTKWALGARPSSGVKVKSWFEPEILTGSPEQQAKVRPEKRWTDMFGDKPNVRKQDALKEISSSGPSLSQSLIEFLPNRSDIPDGSTVDSGVIYSFDAPATPRKVVGLDSLVERAEKEWKSRETDKIVRDEYEILDASGEVKALAKGKGRKGSPRQRAEVVATRDEEDDWERI